ncbi:hypothetical protein [Lysobacter xanthus]
MHRVDPESEAFQRNMALHYLIEHRRKCSFRARLGSHTIEALRARGCTVVGPDDMGIYEASSALPLGRLLTKAERKKHWLELSRGAAALLTFKGGIIASFAAAHVLGSGYGPALLWCWASVCVASMFLDELTRKDRYMAAGVASVMIVLGSLWASV